MEIQQHMEECLGMGVEYQLECGISIEREIYEQHNREVRQHKMKRCDYCNQKVHANEENRTDGSVNIIQIQRSHVLIRS